MLKKIAATDLRVGMFLQGLCGSWTQHPFWRTKFVIKDPKDIRSIVDSGITEVWIDSDKGLDLIAGGADQPAEEVADQVRRSTMSSTANSAALSAAASGTTAAEPSSGGASLAKTGLAARQAGAVSIRDELGRAADICKSANRAVTAMFQEARMGSAIDSAVAEALVDDIAASVLRHPEALISLARLKTADDYTYMHSVAVCALMVSLANQLGLDPGQTHEAGMAGLLHDLGKMTIPLEILNKPGKLTDEEFRIVRDHPKQGHRLLLEGGGSSDLVLDVCLHHHEKMDGSGYPHGLDREEISLHSRMGAICDVYDAITSNRPYKQGWDPAESIKKMSEWCGGHFDTRVFQAFVKSVGIYPTGSLVRLASGRLAVVIEQSKQSLLNPIVKAFFSTKSNVYITPELIHLSRTVGAERIVSVESAESWDLKDVDQFWAG